MNERPKYALVVRTGLPGEAGSYHPIPTFPFLIGRSEESNLVLDQRIVDLRHAVINLEDGEITVLDLETFGGTYVNGRRVPGRMKTPIHPGDLLKIGTFRIGLEVMV